MFLFDLPPSRLLSLSRPRQFTFMTITNRSSIGQNSFKGAGVHLKAVWTSLNTALGLLFGVVNCLVVFPTYFNPNNSLLTILQISLLFRSTPALTHVNILDELQTDDYYFLLLVFFFVFCFFLKMTLGFPSAILLPMV